MAKNKTLGNTLCWQGCEETGALKSSESLNGHGLGQRQFWHEQSEGNSQTSLTQPLIPRNWPLRSTGPHEQRPKSFSAHHSNLYYPRLKMTSKFNRWCVKKERSFLRLECYTAVERNKEVVDIILSPKHCMKQAECRTVYVIFYPLCETSGGQPRLCDCGKDLQVSHPNGGLWGELRAWGSMSGEHCRSGVSPFFSIKEPDSILGFLGPLVSWLCCWIEKPAIDNMQMMVVTVCQRKLYDWHRIWMSFVRKIFFIAPTI